MPNARPQPANPKKNQKKTDLKLIDQMDLSRGHIFEAAEAPLLHLGTSYIDVLQLYRLDRELCSFKGILSNSKTSGHQPQDSWLQNRRLKNNDARSKWLRVTEKPVRNQLLQTQLVQLT